MKKDQGGSATAHALSEAATGITCAPNEYQSGKIDRQQSQVILYSGVTLASIKFGEMVIHNGEV